LLRSTAFSTTAARSTALAAEQHERLATVKIALDRVWDLMRQRRALRDAGLDPADASERDADGAVPGAGGK
jgi:hypothetical protein